MPGAWVSILVPNTLTFRLGHLRAPLDDHKIWLDTADSQYLYVLEAPDGSTTGEAVFRGVRFPFDTEGNILGLTQENPGGTLTWINRFFDEGWDQIPPLDGGDSATSSFADDYDGGDSTTSVFDDEVDGGLAGAQF